MGVGSSREEQRMKNMQESLDKLRADAAKFSVMSVLETDALRTRLSKLLSRR
jgi:hypothetical protein